MLDQLLYMRDIIFQVGLAVKTPQDLLDKSKALSNKHKKLKDLVLNMETDVYFLEQKYKSTVRVNLDIRLITFDTSGRTMIEVNSSLK